KPNLVELSLGNIPVDGSFLSSLPERARLGNLYLFAGAKVEPLMPKLRDDLGDLLQPVIGRLWLDLSGRKRSPELIASLSKVETLIGFQATSSRGLSGHLPA